MIVHVITTVFTIVNITIVLVVLVVVADAAVPVSIPAKRFMGGLRSGFTLANPKCNIDCKCSISDNPGIRNLGVHSGKLA